MMDSREQLLAKADECERLAQLATTDQLRRRNAVLALYWVALAGSVPSAEVTPPAGGTAAQTIDRAA
jgi:hypothetical protein